MIKPTSARASPWLTLQSEFSVLNLKLHDWYMHSCGRALSCTERTCRFKWCFCVNRDGQRSHLNDRLGWSAPPVILSVMCPARCCVDEFGRIAIGTALEREFTLLLAFSELTSERWWREATAASISSPLTSVSRTCLTFGMPNTSWRGAEWQNGLLSMARGGCSLAGVLSSMAAIGWVRRDVWALGAGGHDSSIEKRSVPLSKKLGLGTDEADGAETFRFMVLKRARRLR